MVWDIPLVCLGQLSWFHPLPDPSAPSASSMAGQHRKLKSPWLCANTDLQQLKTSACHHRYFHQKSKTQLCVSFYKENYLYPSKNYDNFSYCYNPSDEKLWTWTCILEDIGSDCHSNYILFIPSYEVSWDRLLNVHCWVPCLYFI